MWNKYAKIGVFHVRATLVIRDREISNGCAIPTSCHPPISQQYPHVFLPFCMAITIVMTFIPTCRTKEYYKQTIFFLSHRVGNMFVSVILKLCVNMGALLQSQQSYQTIKHPILCGTYCSIEFMSTRITLFTL